MILQPPSTLLAGPSGSGKTSAIATQLLHGLRVFVIVTEPDGVASLLDSAERLRAPIDKLHWSICTPGAAGWMDLEDMIRKISSMDQKQLADQRDMGKSSFRAPALRFLENLRNFHCDRTDADWGDFTTWDDTASLCIDSLTGWCAIAFGCTVGFKPTANPGEWGIAQNFIQSMLTKINSDRQCFFTLTAHVEKEMDELSGVKKLMVSAIGAKLAPKIPPFFSEVVKCSREMVQGNRAEFRWSTVDSQMDLKNRALPIGATLAADFGPIVAAYRRRIQLAAGGAAGPGASPVNGPAPGQGGPPMRPPAGGAPMQGSAPKNAPTAPAAARYPGTPSSAIPSSAGPSSSPAAGGPVLPAAPLTPPKTT